mgnify:CR=1 FL=1
MISQLTLIVFIIGFISHVISGIITWNLMFDLDDKRKKELTLTQKMEILKSSKAYKVFAYSAYFFYALALIVFILSGFVG